MLELTQQQRRHRGAIALAVSLLGAGCATTSTQWYLNGRSAAEFHDHDAQCTAQAHQAANGQTWNDAGRYVGSGGQMAGFGVLMAALQVGGISANHAACMQSLGYAKAP